MGATSSGEQRLRSRSDFQRFCADLRTSSPGLADLVEALRALAVSELGPAERSRYANLMARYLGASFPASDVRAVASQEWLPEIAMALRGQAPTQGEPPAPVPDRSPGLLPERFEGFDLRELSRERSSSLTVVLMGDEDEHRASIERLKELGIPYLRESSLPAIRDAFERDVVVGLVVGASSWAAGDPRPRQRLRSILALSNLCWVKLVRSAVWASVEDELPELCTKLHLVQPPRTRLAVEGQATITNAELRCLTDTIKDLVYGERIFSYDDFQPSQAQDRILRAATSRYLRDRYHAVHDRETGFHVRTLANRGESGLVCLVSVDETEVAFVVKVSPCQAALAEAQRFRSFAHGTSLKMEFFCHGQQGALVFAPVDDARLEARSLDDMLASRELVGRRPVHAGGIPAIDSAIAALQRFSQKLRPEGVTFCNVEREETETLLARCGPIVVAGETIDPRHLYAHGRQVVDRCARHAIVHGDAHPGNILFSATDTAILIDFECAGLGPACYDLCMLWIHVLASRFVAVGDERSIVDLFRELLAGVPFADLEARWSDELRFAVSHEAVYLAHRALEASAAAMVERGGTREDVYGIVAIILCRELFDPGFQQFTIRCALAAISSLLRQHPG